MTTTAIDRITEVTHTDLSPAEVDLVKSQFAKGASDDELAVFLRLASHYDLDPFAKQLWLVKRKADEPAQIMIGRDGLLAIAQRSGQLDGVVSGVVKQGDTFEFGLREPTHSFGDERGKILGAYAYIYRKDRQYPTRVFAEWSEHGAPMTRDAAGKRINLWSPWSRYPSSMCRKVAESQALRLAFVVSGVTADAEPEEYGDVIDAEVIEDHRRPVGDLAESASAPTNLSEESDVPLATSAADSVPEPGGDENLFPNEGEPVDGNRPEDVA